MSNLLRLYTLAIDSIIFLLKFMVKRDLFISRKNVAYVSRKKAMNGSGTRGF